MAPSAMALQCLLEAELKYNTKKTFCMCVRPKWIKDLQPICITLNGVQLKFVNEHCYLGIKMTSNMSDVSDMQRQIKCIFASGNGIIKHFRHCSEEVKAKLFNSYCTSFYGSVLWVNYTVEAMRKVKSSYNKIFRSLMNVKDVLETTKCMLLTNVNPLFTVLGKGYMIVIITLLILL